MEATKTTCQTCKAKAFHNGRCWTHDNSLIDTRHPVQPTAQAAARQAKKDLADLDRALANARTCAQAAKK